MKLNKNRKMKAERSQLEKNQGKKDLKLILLAVITAALIVWVFTLAHKAKDTVEVAMYVQGVHKGQIVTEEMIQPYELLRGEYEKFTVTNKNGVKKRRLILWEERDKVLGTFAAYPLKANTYCEFRDFIKARTDNSDTILYSFPGKTIVKLALGAEDLQAFKTFLEPGDRINLTASYLSSETVTEADANGGERKVDIEVYESKVPLKDIMLADLLNANGDSILDIYRGYKAKTVYEQVALDNDRAFQESVTPATMLVALTQEEVEIYDYYRKKPQISFSMSLPQRIK